MQSAYQQLGAADAVTAAAGTMTNPHHVIPVVNTIAVITWHIIRKPLLPDHTLGNYLRALAQRKTEKINKVPFNNPFM